MSSKGKKDKTKKKCGAEQLMKGVASAVNPCGAIPKVQQAVCKQAPGKGNPSSPGRKSPAGPKGKKSGKGEICIRNLRKRCDGKSCGFLHAPNPYQWQYEDKGSWVPFTDGVNTNIENSFCDPKLNDTSADLSSNGSRNIRVNFADMTYQDKGGKGGIRRLSTASWGEVCKTRPFVTKWLWYWKNEQNKWQEYDDSIAIEEQFLKGDSSYDFTVGPFKYKIDYKAKEQLNAKTSNKREIRRRPKKVTSDGAKKTETDFDRICFPKEWTGASAGAEYQVDLVTLNPKSDEYKAVAKRFLETMPNTIKGITRIQNPDLWEEYHNMKKKMLRKKTGRANFSPSEYSTELREQLLFHGTREQYIPAIYNFRGFDFRNAGKSTGTVHGKGNYFAKDANYSQGYSDVNRMFAARVLVGDIVRGDPSYTRPPPKNRAKPLGETYDCCVNDEKAPSIFVTFEFGQSYPAYLIDY